MRDRKMPIAKIVPLRGADALDVEERALAAAGLLRTLEKSFSRGFWSLRAPRIPPPRAAAAVSADRDDE